MATASSSTVDNSHAKRITPQASSYALDNGKVVGLYESCVCEHQFTVVVQDQVGSNHLVALGQIFQVPTVHNAEFIPRDSWLRREWRSYRDHWTVFVVEDSFDHCQFE